MTSDPFSLSGLPAPRLFVERIQREKHRPSRHQRTMDFAAEPAHVLKVHSPVEDIERPVVAPKQAASPERSSGDKGKARDIISAIRTLKAIEAEKRSATDAERQTLMRFQGFGGVALSIFPDPVTGRYKDGWQEIGEELKSLLTQQEYDSAKRTTFTAFYTSPVVVTAMHDGLEQLGVSPSATILEPGCGSGNFLAHGKPGQRFIGIELDSLSGRIARVLHPSADVRIENFRDSKLPQLDAVIGNVPFADVKLDFQGQRLSLHDYFIAKSVDSLKPGGVLAVVTSRFTMDKQNAATREALASQADLLGAIRLPSDAFKKEGTAVVTDIVFLRKRLPGQEANHAGDWLETGVKTVDGSAFQINKYFVDHPDMVLGDFSRKDTLYAEGFSVLSNGDLTSQLKQAIGRITEKSVVERANPPPDLAYRAALSSPPIKLIGHADTAFTQPPPIRHLTEGSFFIENNAIFQIEGGQGKPVVYGGTELKDNGTMTGKRLAKLIEIRDAARLVLQSQNEGWPEENRKQARRKLNFLYDSFAANYGPINKTTFSQTKDDTQIRRMPNLVKFREDPDAMLVMSLEEYDEATGQAEKAAIMKRDVVGPKPPVKSVATAEEGLLVSLDHKGVIDLAYIAELYGKSESHIIAELGDLIYRDPASKEWQTADAYLSGNVREKLKIAEAAGPDYAHNAVALRSVQPEDVLPGDIDANLGAPWIPREDIQAFAAELFNVAPQSITIGHVKKDAHWGVEGDYRAMQSVAATSEYGTPRANGISLLEMALNLKTPMIYDIGPNDERIPNPEATLAAKEKQRIIKEKFKAWIFADPDRAERLVRIYNDAYNNLRPRLFDGSHLEFPGMSKAIKLNPHQVDAVWRCMAAGNTLLAHCVGAGKSYEMAAAAMKMKQAGLAKKPLLVVPNHMLEQFSREFMQLYPNAKILVASKDDMTKERRKMLTAKIASSEWDAIITTHSSFERMSMSRDYQEKFLLDQINEYEELLCDKANAKNRNIIKALEKQKVKRAQRLKDLSAEDKKDDGLVFDELGIDQIFIDELQYFKNLDAPTKMERVAGIQTGGSERAFDLYMKGRYLDEQHPGHGVVGATGTPVSNSMVELYTMQRFLDPKGLIDRGIDHFDAWAASFGEVVDAMEISPDGKTLKPRSRFAKFVNMPELQSMFRAFADVQTAEMLNLPRPALKGGKAETIACPMSDTQKEMQDCLVQRYEKVRSTRVDPRVDNALAITTDGRKLALDARMLASGPDFPQSKINTMVGKIVDIWKETAPTKGTQMVFCDMGVNPTNWGFSAYDDIVEKLKASGIPGDQIAVMGDADTDAKKQALFEQVRQGTVRVLIGSTTKMGTGTNVQKRLVALHHLDAPWKPAEVEQREGRILRQGNMNKEVQIYRYVTEGSFDAYMWQALETKARFINQIMTGESTARKAEDIGGQELSYAEVKAIASGNPAVLTLAEADAEMQRLSILRKNHLDEEFIARRKRTELPMTIDRLQTRIANLTADIATIRDNHVPASPEGLARRLANIPETVRETRSFPLGTHHGLKLSRVLHPNGAGEVALEGQVVRATMLSKENQGARAVLNAAERLLNGYDDQLHAAKVELGIAEGQKRDYEARIGKLFPYESYMRSLGELRDQLRVALTGNAPEGSMPAEEIAGRIKALKAENTVEAAPERIGVRKASRAETPVTARIRERMVETTVAAEEPSEQRQIPVEAKQPAVEKRPSEAKPSHFSTMTKRRGFEQQGRLF